MQNLVDRNGRTIWFAGPPGPMKPPNSKSRGKRSSKKEEEGVNDHDYTPKKAKKKSGQKGVEKGPKNSSNKKKAKKKTENGTAQNAPKNGTQKRNKTENVASTGRRARRSSSRDQ